MINTYICQKKGSLIQEIGTDVTCEWRVKSETFLNCTWVACNYGPFTLEEVGEMMGVTRERIRQIEECEKISTNGNRFKSGALVKLRKPHILRMIRAYRGIVNTESW